MKYDWLVIVLAALLLGTFLIQTGIVLWLLRHDRTPVGYLVGPPGPPGPMGLRGPAAGEDGL